MRIFVPSRLRQACLAVTWLLWMNGCGDPSTFQEKSNAEAMKSDKSGENGIPGQSGDLNNTDDPGQLGKAPVQVEQPIEPSKSNPNGPFGPGDNPAGNPGGGTVGGNAGGGNSGGMTGGAAGGGAAGGNMGGGAAGGTIGGITVGGGSTGGAAGGTTGGITAGGGATGGMAGGTAGGGTVGGTTGGTTTTPPAETAPVVDTNGVAGGVDGTLLICMNLAKGTMVVHDIGVERWYAANFNFIVNTTSGPVARKWQPQRDVPFQLPGNWQGVCDATPTITKFRPLQMNGRKNPPTWWRPAKYNQGAQRCVAIDDGDDGRPGAVELDLLWNLKRCQ